MVWQGRQFLFVACEDMGKGCGIVALVIVGLLILGSAIEIGSRANNPYLNANTSAQASLIDCPPAAGVEPPHTSPTSYSVKFAVAPALGGLKPTLEGRTNLPSGTQLIVTLRHGAPSYDAQSKLAVEPNGCFATDQFTDDGGDLSPGRYSVLVTMPVSSGQPDSVQRIIGTHGEYIIGPFVKRLHRDRFAEYRTSVVIAPGSPSPQVDTSSNALQAAEEICNQLVSSRMPPSGFIVMSTDVMQTNTGLRKDFMIDHRGLRLAIVCRFNNGVARLTSGSMMR